MPPVQVVLATAPGATTIPVGKVSLKSKAVAATRLPVLSMLNVRVDVPPWAIVVVPNALLNPGAGAGVICNVAVAAGDAVGRIEVSVLDVFGRSVKPGAVTVACTVQLAPAATEPPE